MLPLTVGATEIGLVTAFAGVVGAWLHARYGRKFRLKVGEKEIEAEAPTLHAVERLLKRGEELQQHNQPKAILES